MPTRPGNFKDWNLLICIFYEGPWEKLSSFCMGLRKDNSLRWVIPDDPKGWRKAAEALANWAEKRDQIWRAKYAIRRKNPHKRWKRQVP